MSAPSLATEAAAAGDYPVYRFNQRERKLLESVKVYVDALSPDTVITTQGDILVGDASGDAVRLAKGTSGLPLVAGASTVSYSTIGSTALAAGISFSHRVMFAGSFTTAGGDVNEAITVSGALATDIAIVVLHTKGASPVTLLTAQAATDAINLEFSADPSTDHQVRYMVLRAIA